MSFSAFLQGLDLYSLPEEPIFKKTSHACYKQHSSYSILSPSIPSPRHSLIQELFSPRTPVFTYKLQDIVQTPVAEGHSEIQLAVVEWLSKVIPTNRVDTELELPFCTSDRKVVVDIGLCKGTPPRKAVDRLYVQFEVESNKSRTSTIRKLGMGLVDQLCYYRNHDTEVRAVSGFFISLKGGFEEITCKWVDEKLCFAITSSLVEGEAVFDRIKSVLSKNYATDHEVSSRPRSSFLVPLTKSYIAKRYGNRTVQLLSGQSIVIQCMSPSQILKHSLNDHYSLKLQLLLDEQRRRDSDLTVYFALPLDKYIVFSKIFYKFKLYSPPITKSVAKDCLRQFVKEVVVAVRAFHEFGFAHLDIRLENICFDRHNKRAVLIDLDRSQEVAERAQVSQYGVSTMYDITFQFENDVLVEHLDWRQVSIMFYFIVTKDVPDYHSIELSGDHHEYLKTIYNKGIDWYIAMLFLLEIIKRIVQQHIHSNAASLTIKFYTGIHPDELCDRWISSIRS